MSSQFTFPPFGNSTGLRLPNSSTPDNSTANSHAINDDNHGLNATGGGTPSTTTPEPASTQGLSPVFIDKLGMELLLTNCQVGQLHLYAKVCDNQTW